MSVGNKDYRPNAHLLDILIQSIINIKQCYIHYYNTL